MGHRFTDPASADGDAQQPRRQRAPLPGFNAVGKAGGMQPLIDGGQLGADPGFGPIGAGGYHRAEGLVEAEPKGSCTQQAPE
jgi:hypothetical protein